MKMLIDSHCHLLSDEYENVDLEIKNAIAAGVNRLIINGVDVNTSMEAVKLANKYKEVYAAVGIGPEEVLNINREDINTIEKLCNSKKVVAIGEIGLDYYWTTETKDQQKKVLTEMLKIANKKNLPVIVHNRNATNDIYKLLKEYNNTGIMHCFSGSKESAQEFIKLGFLIGIGGVVTFKNAKKLKEVVESISIENISLETDSPYLTPEPNRGKKNNPANLIFIASQIAKIKDLTLEEVVNQTGHNVCAKFDFKV